MAIHTRTTVAPPTEKAATPRSIVSILNSIDTDIVTNHGSLCIWFAIQNKDAAKIIYVQPDNDATADNDNVEIGPGVYRQYPPCSSKYALDEEFIRVSADDPVFSIDIMWG